MTASYASYKLPFARALKWRGRSASPVGKPTARVLTAALCSGIAALSSLVGCSASGPGSNGQPGACATGLTRCDDGTCASLQSDPENCGMCGRGCAAGQACSAGTCACTTSGQRVCGGQCTDTQTSAAHCGGCDVACSATQTCTAGVCLGNGSGSGPGVGAGGVSGSGGALGGGGAPRGGASGGGGAVGTGNGLQVGSMCFPKCTNGSTDPNGTGYGFEAGRSCVVVGSMPALQAPPCTPPAAATGNGYLVTQMTGMMVCESSCKHPELVMDAQGYGYEAGLGCIVDGSVASVQNARCTVTVVAAAGNGYQVVDPAGRTACIPACRHPELADPQGYGFEAQLGCVVDGSLASVQNARCTLVARTLPPPGNGFLLGGTCFPPCGAGALNVVAGYGFDLNRACVVPGSTPSIQGVPCVPPPATVTGACPQVLQCPVINGTMLPCGCTWVVGLAERKRQILATAGATQYLIASAMMETTDLTTNYPAGDGKTGDSFNAGIAKQNWGMIRRCHPAWNAMSAAQFTTSTAMNTNLALDVQVYNECRSMFGANWWSGHRAGFGSLGSNSQDIQVFKGGMDWTNMMLATHLGDDVRVWVTVPPI